MRKSFDIPLLSIDFFFFDLSVLFLINQLISHTRNKIKTGKMKSLMQKEIPSGTLCKF